MNERRFAKRLAQELPRWQKEGWVSAEGGPAILADLAARETAPMWASTLALIGAILLGLGVITWFAAHWNEIGKLAKLLLVALALMASHLGHGFCLSRGALPKLAQGMALLSVLFFGAAIMLIGQIYNIDAHFPDGIALWAAGGLLTALLFASQPALVASLALAALWTWYEQFDYRGMNWPLLGYLALAAWPLLRHGWSLAARGWGILLILWLLGWHAQPWFDNTGTHWETHAHVRLFILQILGFAGGWALAQASEHPFARAVRADFLFVALVGAFAFTFPRLAAHGPAGAPAGDPLPWLMAFAGVVAIYAYGIARLVQASELSPGRLRIGIALAAAFAALLLIEIAVPRSGSGSALLWNALFLGILYWIGDLGMRRGDRLMVNYAFTGFFVWVLARYFDTFWTLMDRSLFFMAGGILLLTGGGWLEHRRRTLLRDLAGRIPS